MESGGAPWAPVPSQPWPSGSSHLADAAGSRSLHRRRGAVALAGSWAKPLIAHRTSPAPQVLPHSQRFGRGAGTQHIGVRSALHGGVVGESVRPREVSLHPGSARRWGWRLTFPGRTDSNPGREAFGGWGDSGSRWTYRPRTGGVKLPGLRSPKGCDTPGAPGAVRTRGSGRRTEKPGLWPMIYPLPNPVRPLQREMGGGRSLGGSLAAGAGGVSGEIGCSGMPVLATTPPSLSSPSRCPHSGSSGVRASRAWWAGGLVQKQRGMRGTWDWARVDPPLLQALQLRYTV